MSAAIPACGEHHQQRFAIFTLLPCSPVFLNSVAVARALGTAHSHSACSLLLVPHYLLQQMVFDDGDAVGLVHLVLLIVHQN